MSTSGSAPEFANPMPAGLVALAMVCFGLFAMYSGQVSHAAIPILAVWLFGGFVIQFVVALIEFKEKNPTGSNLFLIFAVVFMLIGCVGAYSKYLLKASGLPFDSNIEGWLWIAPSLWVWGMAFCFLKAPKGLFILGAVICLGLPFLIMLNLGLQGDRQLWAQLLSYAFLIAACIATYLAIAMSINMAYGKQILPIGTPIIK